MTYHEFLERLNNVGFTYDRIMELINEEILLASYEHIMSKEDIEGSFLLFASGLSLKEEGFNQEQTRKILYEMAVNAKHYVDDLDAIEDFKFRVKYGLE